MATVFFTGFPGQLGSELVPRVLLRPGRDEAICLVEPKFVETARGEVRQIVADDPSLRGRVRVLAGDITREDLGLGRTRVSKGEITEVYHLAAVYDLGVGRDLATLVNVGGTRNLLAFARSCPRLKRFHYMSTAYVSGRTPGEFTEADLDRGQAFNNWYERTKYLAEVEVRREMGRGLPATIYRPSIVVGEGATGATRKYDGLYFIIRWLLRQPRVAVMPVSGDPRQVEFNIVPLDFVVAAVAYLGAQPDSEGRVYQLTDPRPLSVAEMLEELARVLRRRLIRPRLPLGAEKWVVDHVPGVSRWVQVPSQAFDYLSHPTRYRSPATQAALEGSELLVPRFPEYLDRLVEFVCRHPCLGSAEGAKRPRRGFSMPSALSKRNSVSGPLRRVITPFRQQPATRSPRP
jgi:thioester reductase-like protein